MDEQILYEEQAVRTKTVKKRSKKVLLAAISLVLVAAIGFAVYWYLTADDRLYAQGLSCLQEQNFQAALEIFQQLEDYGDSRELIKKCQYGLGDNARLGGNLEKAREHYILAQDYHDADFQVQRMAYALGHRAFMKDSYDEAQAWFSQLKGDISLFGEPHFRTIEDAIPYLRQQGQNFAQRVKFYLAEEPGEHFLGIMKNLLIDQYSYSSYYDKCVTLDSIVYYPGDRIYAAWAKDDITTLTQQEQQVLSLALELVDQAKSQCDTQLELQLWLHDWLCKKVTYESPNMDVKRKEYLGLTELSCIGAMLEGKANCQGYTDAFALLGRLAGLQVSRLFGKVEEGHTWNIVKLDGLWYIVDVTFDDMSDENYDGWNYTYFNTGWDPEVYEIYGGQAVTEELADEPHPVANYFAHTQSSFTDMSDAAYDLVSQNLWEGKKWAYVKIDGTVVDINSFGNTLYNTVARRISWSISWNYWVYDYNGDSYIIVQWN